ncbi:MAG: CBS domain-containing protein [Nanoarchaeota archaeon]|nr:CBS domain-containing protein [Nanoarchaeota archaeon]
MKTGYKVADAMTTKPVTVSPDTTLMECGKIMEEKHVGALIVKDNENIGIITEQDIVRKAVAKGLSADKNKASDIMETSVRTIEPDADIFDALMKMKELNIRHLPVMQDNELIGLLTTKDILKIEPQLFDLLAEKIELKEEERKPINNDIKEKEGVCNLCGNYSENLREKDGVMVCEKCGGE